ncbi:serine/threonine protein kinase [Podila verticillata NRRL 6337]|nr:serine/threonine protein kinase [Podila verticillata NRRL 6337]
MATPPPLTNPTVCASSDGGSWLVGVNKDKLAIYKFGKDGAASSVNINGSITTATIDNFNGGQCFESGNKRLFFVSDNPNGYLDTTNNNTWVYLQADPGYVRNLVNPNQIALDVGPVNGTAPGVTIYSIANNRLYKWDGSALKPVSVDAAANAVPWSDVIGLASSDANAHLWAMFTNTTGTFATELTLGTPLSTNTVGVPNNSTRLIPMASESGVATVVLPQGTGGVGGTAAITIWKHNLSPETKNVPALANSLFVVGDNTISIINPDTRQSSVSGAPPVGQPASPNTPPPGSGPPTGAQPSPSNKTSNIGIIIGSIAGVLAVVAIAVFFLIQRRRRRRGGRAKHLFPASKQDDTLVPLGIYHQNRDGPPENLNRLQHDLANLGYDPRPNDQFAHSRSMAPPAAYPSRASHMSNDSRSSIHNQFDETIPVEAMLTHHQHERHTPQGLTHSISVSSTTSKFARRNAKTGRRFEEKIQLQVIQYEVDDAHTISPHGHVGRLVLGTYHVISPPRPARSVKAQGPAAHQGVARSGTVLVRRSRLDYSSSGGGTRSPSPSPDAHAESSMLLTDVENQHTFETATLKWYMTEMHWKREAALLKHLKSPIFVVELLESYCIPALQIQANSYPFVNAMGGCSSLLSDLGPVRTSQHARAILRSISGAVDWCHRHGVVHLNLQPGSFFLEDGINPKAEDASWKLWDFTCARFIGEAIGSVGGGGIEEDQQQQQQQQQQQLRPEAYPFLEQGHHEYQMDRIGGNPLPAAYTAPELLEAWRAGDTTFPVEAGMDTWSLGCVYYEILAGQPLFQNEAEAWALVGGWSGKERWTSKDFRVPYPPTSTPPSSSSPTPISAVTASTSMTMVQDMSSALEKCQILDPSGSVAQLLRGMLCVNADERMALDIIMEKIY